LYGNQIIKIMETQLFTVEVWYRFVVNGEQEKEMQNFIVEAINTKHAIELALAKFKSHSAIPFKANVL